MTVMIRSRLYFLGVALTLAACGSPKTPVINMNLKEYQLTSDAKGHYLNQRQAFSSDDQWLVYDNRNDGSQIGLNPSIEMVNIGHGEVKLVYSAPNANAFGPGVGAVAFNPKQNEVLFIHGLSNHDTTKPYGITRRTGLAVDLDNNNKLARKDARDVVPPFTPGALRGGTHAHSYSGDGRWISFTYNDDVVAVLSKTDSTKKDLRNIGVMIDKEPVSVKNETAESFSGDVFSVIVSETTENPKPGSDEIEKAYEEGWVGTNGYLKPDGSRIEKALAFLGDTRDANGQLVAEVFIVDLDVDLSVADPERPLEGTAASRPFPPAGVRQRRVTYTTDRKNPGVQGPRQWLRSLPDGSLIFFPMKDDSGFVQVHAVSPNGGDARQITQNSFSLDTSFSISADGIYLAYGYNQEVYLTNIQTGETSKVSPERSYDSTDLENINWSNSGHTLAYNRKVVTADGAWYQVFILK
ncbi:DUF3748 domain-containing protein [uncultured Imperialibacter sp.]|uniref:DUF3748 domain-containing protein n=1 Tax=uncultured Imperialibacter sp. TaxID=1672639 RepID=UPI0030DD9B80